tara:strand:+ start:2232 stop:2786 length:555 start_codon:yes stop_codon:yes gene_type:complete
VTKLPFKTAPQAATRLVGNDKIGTLEFPVVGDLTVREQAYITDALAKKSTFLELARVANKVSRAAKIQPVAAHRFLTKCVTANMLGKDEGFDEKEENLRIKFAREIEEVSTFLLKTQWERQLVTVAALVRYRLEGMEKFSPDDCRDLSQQLIVEIYTFALEEQGSAEGDAVLTSEDDLAEQLGK